MAATNTNAINYFSAEKWVVSTVVGEGTHSTIASALTSASSGDTIVIMPGTYAENPTLKAGVNLAAFGSDSGYRTASNVIIQGKCTLTAAGTSEIFGVQLQTNSDYLLANTGSAASIIILNNCDLNCVNNTGINFSSSSSSARVNILNCTGDLGTTGIGLYTSSSSGNINVSFSIFSNTGASTTTSSNSAGIVQIFGCNLNIPIATSSTGAVNIFPGCLIDTSGQNTTALTANGSGGGSCYHTLLNAGTASAATIGTGVTYSIYDCTIGSSNTNAITGIGTLNFANLTFSNSSSKINTTTTSQSLTTDFSKMVIQTFTGSGTYTPTTSMKYCTIEVCGGGGGGGGAAASGATTAAVGQSAGGGGYARKTVTAATIGTSQIVTVGALASGGGSGNHAGTAGNTSSVGSIVSATGGTAGNGGAATSGSSVQGQAGGTGSSGDVNITGGSSTNGVYCYVSGIVQFNIAGNGGGSYFGGSTGGVFGNGNVSSTGNNGGNYGCGGTGGISSGGGAAAGGGSGSAGLVVITEFL